MTLLWAPPAGDKPGGTLGMLVLADASQWRRDAEALIARWQAQQAARGGETRAGVIVLVVAASKLAAEGAAGLEEFIHDAVEELGAEVIEP